MDVVMELLLRGNGFVITVLNIFGISFGSDCFSC
jgi:hypothetical protein